MIQSRISKVIAPLFLWFTLFASDTLLRAEDASPLRFTSDLVPVGVNLCSQGGPFEECITGTSTGSEIHIRLPK